MDGFRDGESSQPGNPFSGGDSEDIAIDGKVSVVITRLGVPIVGSEFTIKAYLRA